MDKPGLMDLLKFWAVGAPAAFVMASYLIHRRKWALHEGSMAFLLWPIVITVVAIGLVLWGIFKVFVGGLWVLEMIFRQSARLYGEPVPPSEIEAELKGTKSNPNRDAFERVKAEVERVNREHALRMASRNEQVIKKKQELANAIRVNTKKDGSVH